MPTHWNAETTCVEVFSIPWRSLEFEIARSERTRLQHFQTGRPSKANLQIPREKVYGLAPLKLLEKTSILSKEIFLGKKYGVHELSSVCFPYLKAAGGLRGRALRLLPEDHRIRSGPETRTRGGPRDHRLTKLEDHRKANCGNQKIFFHWGNAHFFSRKRKFFFEEMLLF